MIICIDLSNESYIAKMMDRPAIPIDAYKNNGGSRKNLNRQVYA
jgi:hypothetical protein